MIVKTEEGLGFLFSMPEHIAETIGDERLGHIDRVLFSSFVRQAQSSIHAAETGAMRWHPNLRPEVLIDATGRML